MARLELRDVSKVYAGGVVAVERAAIDIGDGEFIVLVGPSGCGKSTILRMVAGLETITSGDVLIDGARVNAMEPGDRDIAMVFQTYALYPHMTVFDNMAYGLRNQGMRRANIEKRITEAAEILQLTELLRRKPRQLSGGQRQRVAMGRAIVREPKAFLLDEPLSNLDAKLRGHMRGELRELHRRLAATFLYVTHDQIEAMSLADRIVVMNEGRVEQIGTPREVYDRPCTRFVAEFIGSPPMNFLPGRVLERAEAWIGVRAEAIDLLVHDQAGDGDIRLGGRLESIEDLGADRLAHVSLNGAALGHSVIVRVRDGQDVQLGAAASISIKNSQLHRFDENGRSIAAST